MIEQSHVSQLMGEMFNGMGLDRIGKKKKEIISNFPIPTTKDDMLEFMSLALPKSRKIGNFFTANQPENKEHNTFVPVWKAKCEQIVMKAKKKRIGEKLYAMSPLKNKTIPVEIVSSHYVDPKGERVRS